MDLLGGAVLLCNATTRVGLIALAKHMGADRSKSATGNGLPHTPHTAHASGAHNEALASAPSPLQLICAVRQNLDFSGRVLSQILINITQAVEPLVWTEAKGYRINTVAVSPDRIASAGKAGPNVLSRRDIEAHCIKNSSIVRHENTSVF
jgi:hypothetical protein